MAIMLVPDMIPVNGVVIEGAVSGTAVDADLAGGTVVSRPNVVPPAIGDSVVVDIVLAVDGAAAGGGTVVEFCNVALPEADVSIEPPVVLLAAVDDRDVIEIVPLGAI